MAVAALIPVASASTLEAEEAARRAAEEKQNSQAVQGLAAHVRKRWETVRDKRGTVEARLLQCLRQRNGEYDPDKLAEIRKQGGSEIYMSLTSVKCRGASSWLRDTLMGSGTDKPWCLDATPVPDLPPDVVEGIKGSLAAQIQQALAMGVFPSEDAVRAEALRMKDVASRQLQDEARDRVDRMELKMEDQLLEGGFLDALSAFLDDIVTFPAAILKGPVARKRRTLQWKDGGLVPVETIRMEWERVDPFKFYPAPWVSDINDGFLIERHMLTRGDLEALDGVEGYDSDAIKQVLSEFDTGRLREWLSVDSAQAEAEGKPTDAVQEADVVDALQLWDVVTGAMLKEWGMKDASLEDGKSYPAEVWMVGATVIRAVLNYEPLGRKPYYVTSYEKVPGTVWGNGVADLIRDCQAMCNAAARALSNNMGLSSGPQVGVNVSRLPNGETISQMYPWKIWQFKASEYQGSATDKPIEFFQPQSNAEVLMAVFEKYSMMADEYSGIPRYMTGEHAPGAGRTASGLSMLVNNASKGLKQVINNIDTHVLQPLLERLYQHNLRYSDDPDLIGDVNIVAKGAMSLVAKESAAVRRNEYLQMVLNSPVAAQIVGAPGVAELLRDAARMLDLNVDRVVPSREQVVQQMQQAQLLAAQQPSQPGGPETLPDGSPAGGREQNVMVNRASGRNG